MKFNGMFNTTLPWLERKVLDIPVDETTEQETITTKKRVWPLTPKSQFLATIAVMLIIFLTAILIDTIQTNTIFNRSITAQLARNRLTDTEKALFMASHPELTLDQAIVEMNAEYYSKFPDMFWFGDYWRGHYNSRQVEVNVLNWPLVWTGNKRNPLVLSLTFLQFFTQPQGGKLLLWWTQYAYNFHKDYGNCIRFNSDWERFPIVCGIERLPSK